MVGCFGLNECHLPRVPRERLTEANPRIDVWQLHKCGALIDGTNTELRVGNRGYFAAARGPDIFLDGVRIAIVFDEPMPGVTRPWFACPACGRRARYLYLLDPVACRRCHGLRFACRHLGQQTPEVRRITRWRRRLGIDPAPFAPIPQRPVHHVRFHRIVERIRAEEMRLVGHLQTVTRDLERRIRVRRARGEW